MTWQRRFKRWGLFLRRLQREIGYDDCMGMAAQIAFFMMLSLFPFLIFIVSLISYLPLESDLAGQVLPALREQLPPEAYNLVERYFQEQVRGLLARPSDELLGFGLLASLWSASMGVGALITTINRAYNIRPRRSLPTQKLLAIVLTLVLTGIWVTSMAMVILGPNVAHTVFQWLGLASDSQNLWTTLRLPLAFLLNLAALAILYYYAPESRQAFRWIMPGALTSTVLWLVMSTGFRLFVRNFATYNKLYGSLTAFIVLMVWLWLTGLIILLGAEINALMKRLDREDGHARVRLLR